MKKLNSIKAPLFLVGCCKYSLKMKLTTLLLIMATLFKIQANTYAQSTKLTIELENASVEEVFSKIESLSDFRFVYNHRKVNLTKKVSVNFKNEQISDILKSIFSDTDIFFTVKKKLIVLKTGKLKETVTIQSSTIPQQTIEGTIIDANGMALPGTSIIEKGTTNGTQSDFDGNFSLDVADQNAILVVSYIGYGTKEVAINGKTNITISLDESVGGLDEVIVVGYGTQKKANLTGAVVSVGAEELIKRPVANIANLLQGKVAGLEISSASAKPGDDGNTIRLRGAGTFSGAGNNPLVLINGISGDMSSLDPDDIESVTVLKDAASAAIYGARAANGVILITTKKGKEGDLSITYHGNTQVHSATRLPELLTNSADYMELWNEGRVRNGQPPHFTQQEIDDFRNHPNNPRYPNFNWVEHTFHPAFAQNHHLTVSGGNEKTTFSASLGYLNQGGITSNYDYQRYTARISFNSKVRDWISVGGEINFVKKDIQRSGWDNNVDYQVLAIYGAGPNYTPTITLPDGTQGYVARYSSDINEWTVRNPDAQDASGSITENRYFVLPQFNATVKVLDGLIWNNKVALSLDNNFYKGHEHPVDNYYFKDGSYAHNNATWRLGVNDNFNQNLLTTFYSTLNYDKVFNENHNVNVLLGYNQESNLARTLRGSRINFPTNDIKELDAGSSEGQSATGNATEWAIKSIFGRFTYNYKSRYLFEVNARYDGTSRIAADTRWGFFPSVSVGWRLSEEPFAEELSWLDNLKLRASWGQLGNQNVGGSYPYPYQDILSTTSYPFSNSVSPGVRTTRLVDKSLKWETTTIKNLGIDLSVQNGLFSATVEVYDKVTEDILYQIPIPASVGLDSPTVNYGKMGNKGYELVLGHRKQFGDFTYDVHFNLAHNKNKVLEILAPSYGQRTIQEGIPFNSHYLVEWIGIFQDQDEIDNGPLHQFNPKPGDLKFKDQNGDNKIDADDRVVVDGAFPKFIYGGGFNLAYKNFDLSAFFQGVEGRKISAQTLAWGLSPYIQGSPPPVDFVENRWTPENRTNQNPAMYVSGYGPVSGTPNTYRLLDASYLRLKNLSIGYKLPKTVSNKIGLNNLRFYISGDNLFTITDYPGADPEKADTGWFTAYPQVSIYTLGVKIEL